MKKLLLMLIMLFVLAFSVSAVTSTGTVQNSVQCIGNVKVHTVDNSGNNLQGVLVAPEWKFSSTGWNDFLPKEQTTDSNGLATNCLWLAVDDETLQVNYATKAGYTCTSGEDTRIVAVHGQNVLESVCTPDAQVPEFGVVAGTLALIGAIGIIAYSRKK